MRVKTIIFSSIACLILFNLYLLHSLNNLKKDYLEGQKFNKNYPNANYESEIAELKKKNNNLDYKLGKLEERQAEAIFFNNNERRHERGGRFLLNHCCTSAMHNSVYLYYDLLIENPVSSGDYDDFGTTSYISFDMEDKINSFDVISVGSGIFKIVIDSEYKHTEGVIYPDSDDGYYYRLFDLSPVGNYYSDVKTENGGYRIIVRSDPGDPKKVTGEYVVKKKGQGFEKEEIKELNSPNNN